MATPDFFQTHEFTQLRTTLLQFGIPFIFEWSAQISRGRISANRGLFSFPIAAMGGNAYSYTCALCRRWDASQTVVSAIAKYFPQASHVHFGLEFEATYRTAKCYLEFESTTRFLGFKWSSDPAKPTVVSRYQHLEVAGWQTVQAYACRAFQEPHRKLLLPLLRRVQIAAESAGSQALSLLEVSDEGSERLSYDLNCYEFEITLSSIRDVFESILTNFDVLPSDAHRWLECSGEHTLGHIAFGTNRFQQNFVTIYHQGGLRSFMASVL
jgi:hypothetical protein